MRKFTLIFLLVVLFPWRSAAQDIIVRTTGDTIRCLVLELTDQAVLYQVKNDGVVKRSTIQLRDVSTLVVEGKVVFSPSTPLTASTTPAPSAAQSGAPLRDMEQPRADRQQRGVPRGGFRLSVGGGVSFKLGKGESQGISLDAKERFGAVIHGDVGGFFNDQYGVVLTVHHVRNTISYGDTSGYSFGRSLSNPFGYSSDDVSEAQRITFVGPSFLMRNRGASWSPVLGIGVGPIFLSDIMRIGDERLELTGTSFGASMSIGIEGRLGSQAAIGFQLAMTAGVIGSATDQHGNTWKSESSEDRMSLSSVTLSAYLAFGPR